MYTMGIDVGSSSSKAVILRDGSEVVAEAVVQRGTGSSGPGRVMEEIAARSGLKGPGHGLHPGHRLWPLQPAHGG